MRLPPLVLLIALLACALARAAPFVPQDDATVLERLPAKPVSASGRALRELRARLAANPRDAALATELADAYYELALRQGDPRYIGYAEAALAPWRADPDPPDALRVVRAALAQYLHDFDAALNDLDVVIARDPNLLTAWSYRAVIHMVRASYAEAKRDCAEFRRRGGGLLALACEATVEGLTGSAGPAYAKLESALAAAADAPRNVRLWVLVRLAEMAQRLGRDAQAEQHYRAALGLGIDDQYLLVSFAEFLLERNRPAEVVALLADRTRNDVLLLRLALAEKALGAPRAAERQRAVQARIDAARMRQDKLHLSDEAIFELRFLGRPREAARLARENWDSGQREPSDARILLEAAAAAGDAQAAKPALEWLASTRHEDAVLRELAARVGASSR